MKEEYFDNCEYCNGKGGRNSSKKKYVKCPVCMGSGSIPNFKESLIDKIQKAANNLGVDSLLIPTSETVLKQYAGLMKETKAKLFYETIPEKIGFKKSAFSEIELSREEGEPVSSNVFWKKEL